MTDSKATATAPTAEPKAEDKSAMSALSAAQTKAVKALETVSAKIRYLDSESFSRGDISRILTEERGKLVRYQHVRNVLITPLAKKAS